MILERPWAEKRPDIRASSVTDMICIMARSNKAKKSPQRPHSYGSGLGRRRQEVHYCGLCGANEALTKTHIPPQCAGNNDRVLRYRYIQRGTLATRGRTLEGGMYGGLFTLASKNGDQ